MQIGVWELLQGLSARAGRRAQSRRLTHGTEPPGVGVTGSGRNAPSVQSLMTAAYQIAISRDQARHSGESNGVPMGGGVPSLGMWGMSSLHSEFKREECARQVSISAAL